MHFYSFNRKQRQLFKVTSWWRDMLHFWFDLYYKKWTREKKSYWKANEERDSKENHGDVGRKVINWNAEGVFQQMC